eukprot:507025_1
MSNRSHQNEEQNEQQNYRVINESDIYEHDKQNCLLNVCIPRRYCIVILLFFGLFNVYTMRVNLSVAIEPMSCQFKWTSFESGVLLASFFVGYTFGNIPGGILAKKYGGKLIFGIGVLTTAILSLFLPLATYGHLENASNITCQCDHSIASDWCFYKSKYTQNCDNVSPDNICNYKSYLWALSLIRVLMGLVESVTYPAMYSLLNAWTPKADRSFLVAICFAGSYIGNAAGFPISSFIVDGNNWYQGWPNVFYFFAITSILWWILWILFMSNSPFNDKCITQRELILFKQDKKENNKISFSISNDKQNKIMDSNNKIIEDNIDDSIPWKQLLTHKVAICLYITHFCYNWSFYTLLTELPTYLNKELGYNLKKGGIVSIIPYLGQFMVSLIGSRLLDKLIIYGIIQRTYGRKIAQIISFIIPGMLLVICGYLNNKTIIVILMSFAASIMGLKNAAFAPNFVDVSPTLSSVMYGISNTFGTIPGIISPILCGFIRSQLSSNTAWKLIFYIAFIIFVIGTIVYCLFTTTEIVPQLNSKKIVKKENL